MGAPEDRPGPSLLPAVELVAAWTHARSDPEFYWTALQRVMSDVVAPDVAPDALAELIFSLSSLAGMLLDQLAEQRCEDPSTLLTAINLAHHAH